MMNHGRMARITSVLKTYDSKLYCGSGWSGKPAVFRETVKEESYDLGQGNTLLVMRPTPHLVFHLTHDWRPQGRVVDWGIEPIMKHLRESDLWKRDIVSDLEKQEEEIEAKADRHRQNQTEAFLKDFRKQFAKTFSDVNTSNLEKKDLRKKKEKSKWQL